MSRYWSLAAICAAGACSGSAVEEVERPRDEDVAQSIRADEAGDIAVAAFHSGGAAGDTIYKLIACPTGSRVCDNMGSVDTHGGPPPEITTVAGKLSLVISERDSLWGFSNVTNYLQRGPNRRIMLRYRSTEETAAAEPLP